jgi:ABC-2 type transport system permease protein
MLALFALALGALGSALVAVLRGGVVAVLSVFLGASYLLLILAPLFGWPDWTLHLSLLDVYGNPYTVPPEAWRLLTFGGVFAAGLAAALALTQRQALTP